MNRSAVTFAAFVCLACWASWATPAPSKDQPTTAKAKTHRVSMKDKKYAPATLTIKPGETVVWKNDDEHDHTVIADDKSFKSGNISPGDDFEHTFKKAGTFKYACKYHPRMKGTVTVEK
jgi:plastocyanin